MPTDRYTDAILKDGSREMAGTLILAAHELQFKTDIALQSTDDTVLNLRAPNSGTWRNLQLGYLYPQGNIQMQGDRLIESTGALQISCGTTYTIWVDDWTAPTGDNSIILGASNYRWSDLWVGVVHEGDIAFAEKSCVKCDKKFVLGDNIILKVIRFDEETGEPMTIPIHSECANLPQKKIIKEYAVKEDVYKWDKDKGAPIIMKRNKSITKKVTRKRLRNGFEMDEKTGKLYELRDYEPSKNKEKVRTREVGIEEATEEVGVSIKEVVYEDREYFI